MTFKFSYPTVSKEKYVPNIDKPESWYGLSSEVKFCKKCLMSNQRPNMTAEHQHTINTKKDTIKFHSEVCDACKLFEKKESIDYEKRQFELKKLLTSIEVGMDLMMLSFQDQEVKIVFMLLID